MWLDFTASIAGVYQPLPSPALQPPDFEYSQWVVRGSWVYMALTPPAPYQRVVANRPEAHVDFVQDLPLSTLPGLIIWAPHHKIGRASCGERVWQNLWNSVVAVSIIKKETTT